MGGDFGPSVTVPAALDFARRNPGCGLLLVGQQAAIEGSLAQVQDQTLLERIEIVPASEVVRMDDPVEVALRRKKDSSMRVAAELVKSGRAQGCVSAGNTGAWMAITRYVLKTLEGIDRPAIATSLPNQKGGATIMLDLGANVDCTADHLLQFAIMGAALAQVSRHDAKPSVGLLNIGEEIIKGNDTVKLAAEYLRASHLNFYGNVEGNDIFKGTVDVVVCDGFVGNVVLKSVEGLAKMLGSMIHEEFHRSWLTKLSGLIAKPVLNKFKSRVDNRRYNGAALLGLRGVVFKSHGSADSFAFGCALDRAYDAISTGLLDRIASTVAELTRLPDEDRPASVDHKT